MLQPFNEEEHSTVANEGFGRGSLPQIKEAAINCLVDKSPSVSALPLKGPTSQIILTWGFPRKKKRETFCSTIVLFNNLPFPWASEGFLERRIPGKNGFSNNKKETTYIHDSAIRSSNQSPPEQAISSSRKTDGLTVEPLPSGRLDVLSGCAVQIHAPVLQSYTKLKPVDGQKPAPVGTDATIEIMG